MQAKQTLDRKEAQQYLNNFSFQPFFTELMGWNATPATRTVKTVELSGRKEEFHFTTIAEKRGYTVLLCDAIPAYPLRAKLDRLISRDHFEHIIVFTDQQTKRQVWQVSLREKGQPVKLREVVYKVGSSNGEELLQKLQQIAVPLALEESTHLTDLTQAARAAFNREKVTKSFFKQFENEHQAFLKFLKGVPKTTQAWYVSVLINRLMFLYFMQSKSFLDANPSYLTDKLQASTARKKDTFYRDFLCPLFFEGFALKKESRTPAVKTLLGDIPYLNGGLFQKHHIELQAEADGTPIVIPDAAFEKLFAFFDTWTWHLDPDENATGDEIDPDVLGYIFEKYINQKQMGAYYTKEDITGYIAQNTVLPFLFDTARKGCANAFQPDGAIWRMLRDDPDVYIYPAMRRGNAPGPPQHPGAPGLASETWVGPPKTHGVPSTRLDLPPEIAAGLDNVALRTGWNRPIPPEFAEHALPTETWREFIARRRRYDDLRTRIAAGEVHQVNDIITLNLDIRQLALDAIQIAGSEDLVESLYKSIESVTILDPTCGSGAFLFAALELLQPLYQACLLRMQEFVDEAKTEAASKGKELHFNRFAHFRKTLDAAAKHVNIDYFILKTIIVQNLYGVDIMEEATEICKLRLFLKLVAQLDAKQKDKIEPLPDIDFNIRAGNTLVGYARYDDIKKATESDLLDGKAVMTRIDDRLKTVDAAAAQFRRQQTELGGSVTPADKQALTDLYKELEAELDDYLAAEYGVRRNALAKWKRDTKPFHWFCDYHAILQEGGFDVILGNPPYIEYKDLLKKGTYTLPLGRFITGDCGNLYAYTFERCLSLLHDGTRTGLIIPVSSVSTDGYGSLRQMLTKRGSMFISSFNDRPSKLFDGLEHIRLSIILHLAQPRSTCVTTGYLRWAGVERDALFERLAFQETGPFTVRYIPKVGSDLEAQIIKKIYRPGLPLEASYSEASRHTVIYTRKLSHFVQILGFTPKMKVDGIAREPSELKTLYFANANTAGCALSVLNSTLFYWLMNVTSDCRNLNRREIDSFPIHLRTLEEQHSSNLQRLSVALNDNFKANSKIVPMNFKDHGKMEIQCVYPKLGKSIIDEIDRVLAKHYSFTDEELDFIINYDIKYRMGADATTPDNDD